MDRETGSCLIEVSALSRRSQYIVTPQRTLVPSVSTAYLHRDRIEANLFTHGSPESRVTTAPRYSCSTAFASARSMAWVNSALTSTAPTRALSHSCPATSSTSSYRYPNLPSVRIRIARSYIRPSQSRSARVVELPAVMRPSDACLTSLGRPTRTGGLNHQICTRVRVSHVQIQDRRDRVV